MSIKVIARKVFKDKSRKLIPVSQNITVRPIFVNDNGNIERYRKLEVGT